MDQAQSLCAGAREVPALFDAAGGRKQTCRRCVHRNTHQTGVNRLRPTRRRLRRIAFPLLVELRLRNPCCRTRRRFEGWYCRFMSVNQFDARAKKACTRQHRGISRVTGAARVSMKQGVSSAGGRLAGCWALRTTPARGCVAVPPPAQKVLMWPETKGANSWAPRVQVNSSLAAAAGHLFVCLVCFVGFSPAVRHLQSHRFSPPLAQAKCAR